MRVQDYWRNRIRADFSPLVYLNLFTLRGVETLCPFLNDIEPFRRDQTDQNLRWRNLATDLGITEVHQSATGAIDLGVQYLSRGAVDGRTIGEFIARPSAVKWHASWIATADLSGDVRDVRLEIRQGRADGGIQTLSGRQLAMVLRALIDREKGHGISLNMANVWRNPPDVQNGNTEDSANVLLYIPTEQHKLFGNNSKASFVRKDDKAYVDLTQVGYRL